jgi:hypothetical protein
MMLCPRAETTCPHDGCDDVLICRDIPVHIQECPHRSLPCEMCAEIGKFIDIDEHLLMCKLVPVRCPHDCRCEDGTALYFFRKDITHHCTVCPIEEIVCMYASSGCSIRLPRKNMILHENDAEAHIGNFALKNAQGKICRLQPIADQKHVVTFRIRFKMQRREFASWNQT